MIPITRQSGGNMIPITRQSGGNMLVLPSKDDR